MTIIEAIEEANTAAGIHTLVLANISEFSTFLDSFNASDYPVNIVVPFDSNGRYSGKRRKATIPLQGWVLTRVSEEPVNLRSAKAEHDYIDPMRTLAMTFISELLATDVIDPEEPATDSIRPEYAFLASQLFGVSYTVNLPVVSYIC